MRSSIIALTLFAGLVGSAAATSAGAAPLAHGLAPATVALPAADLADPGSVTEGASAQTVQYYRRRYYGYGRRYYRRRYYRRY